MNKNTINQLEIEDVLVKETYAKDATRVLFAIRAMKNYYTPKILERLIDIVNNENDTNKKLQAIYSLSTKPPIKVIEQTLIKQLFNKSEAIRSAAAKVLVEYGERNLSEMYQILNKNETPIETKKTIIWLIGRIGTKESSEFLKNLKEQVKAKDILEYINDALNNLRKKIVKISLEELMEHYRERYK